MIIDHQSAWVVLPATSRSGTGGLLHKIIQRSPPLCTHCTQPLERRTAGLPVYTSKCICEPLHFPDSPQFERREVRWKVGSIICFSFSCCTVACVDSRTTHALTHSLHHSLTPPLHCAAASWPCSCATGARWATSPPCCPCSPPPSSWVRGRA